MTIKKRVVDVKIITSDTNKQFCALLMDALNDNYTLAQSGPQVTPGLFGFFSTWHAVVIKYNDPTKSHLDLLIEQELNDVSSNTKKAFHDGTTSL